MHKATAFAVGRVVFHRLENTESGKQFLRLTIEMTPRNSNGKSFAQRVEALTFRQPAELESGLEDGDWVSVSGEAEAETYTYKGGTRAKLMIVGQINQLPIEPRHGSDQEADEVES